MTATEPVERTLTARDPRLEPWRQFLMAHARVSRRLDDELRAIEPSVVDPRLRGEIAELFEAGRLAAYWKDEAA